MITYYIMYKVRTWLLCVIAPLLSSTFIFFWPIVINIFSIGFKVTVIYKKPVEMVQVLYL